MNERKKQGIVVLLACVCTLALCSCATHPAVVIDATDVDTAIVDIGDTAGTIETQTITVYQTVEKLIYTASPEEKALVKKQFADLQLSETKLRAMIPELARLHGVEIGKLSKEIARLQPFEVECEKQKAGKWRAYMMLGICLSVIAGYCIIKFIL